MQVMRTGRSYAEPVFVKSRMGLLDFADHEARQYIALTGADRVAIENVIGSVQVISKGEELAFITSSIREGDAVAAIEKLEKSGAEIKSRIRLI